jgi:hypothetical protein
MLGSDSGRPMASPSDHRSGVWMPASRSAGPEGGQGRRFSGGRHGEQHNSQRSGCGLRMLACGDLAMGITALVGRLAGAVV